MAKQIFFACALYYLASAGAYAAGICDFRDRSAVSHLNTDAFFDTPRGTLAIGENCNPHNNICNAYLPISHCGAVEYSPPNYNGEISFSFNSSNNCEEGEEICATLSTFLSSTMVMINNRDSAGALPAINTIRNASRGWIPLKSSRRYTAYLNAIPSKNARRKFFELQSSNTHATRTQFETEVIDYWHTNFYAGAGRSDPRETWSGREFFADRVTAEPECDSNSFGCSIKAFLTKFSETSTGVPGNALRVNGKTGWANAVVFSSRAAMTDAYDEYVVVRIHGASQDR